MRVPLVIGLVAALLAGAAASAQTAGPPAGVAPAPGIDAPPRAPTGNVVGRTPLPRYRVPPKSFAECNREAVARRYRGAERRHYVARCQLGVRRLFRRRGATPPQAAPAPAPARTP